MKYKSIEEMERIVDKYRYLLSKICFGAYIISTILAITVLGYTRETIELTHIFRQIFISTLTYWIFGFLLCWSEGDTNKRFIVFGAVACLLIVFLIMVLK